MGILKEDDGDDGNKRNREQQEQRRLCVFLNYPNQYMLPHYDNRGRS